MTGVCRWDSVGGLGLLVMNDVAAMLCVAFSVIGTSVTGVVLFGNCVSGAGGVGATAVEPGIADGMDVLLAPLGKAARVRVDVIGGASDVDAISPEAVSDSVTGESTERNKVVDAGCALGAGNDTVSLATGPTDANV